jgi:hypothetical protein
VEINSRTLFTGFGKLKLGARLVCSQVSAVMLSHTRQFSTADSVNASLDLRFGLADRFGDLGALELFVVLCQIQRVWS